MATLFRPNWVADAPQRVKERHVDVYDDDGNYVRTDIYDASYCWLGRGYKGPANPNVKFYIAADSYPWTNPDYQLNGADPGEERGHMVKINPTTGEVLCGFWDEDEWENPKAFVLAHALVVRKTQGTWWWQDGIVLEP